MLSGSRVLLHSLLCGSFADREGRKWKRERGGCCFRNCVNATLERRKGENSFWSEDGAE